MATQAGLFFPPIGISCPPVERLLALIFTKIIRIDPFDLISRLGRHTEIEIDTREIGRPEP
jgi:hypothetical protein